MAENHFKVEAKIIELNKEDYAKAHPSNAGLIGVLQTQSIPKVWQEFMGYSALTKFDYNNGAPTFNPSSGVPVKAFLNTRTGEIRIFLASIFEM